MSEHRLSFPWRVERRSRPKRLVTYRVTGAVIGFAIALALAPLLAPSVGTDIYTFVWNGTFGTPFGITNLLLISVPLVLAGLAVALAYRIGLWNVGVEGQILMGAWLALFIAFKMSGASGFVLVPIMFVAGAVGGALWMLIPAVARVFLGINEIVTTFLLNFGAVAWMSYWVRGDWFDQAAGGGGTRSRPVPVNSQLGEVDFGSVTAHWGVFLAVGIPIVAWLLLAMTRSGFEFSLAGAAPRTGRYAGINVERKMLSIMLLSGAISGFVGVVNMVGNTHYYGDALANDFGYAALAIAVLAGGSPLAVIPVGVLYGAVLLGGDSMSVAGVAPEAVLAMIGLILVLAASGEALARMRFVRTKASKRRVTSPSVQRQEEVA